MRLIFLIFINISLSAQTYITLGEAIRYNDYINTINNYPRGNTSSYSYVYEDNGDWVIKSDNVVSSSLSRIFELTGDITSDSINTLIQSLDSLDNIFLYDIDTINITSRINLKNGVNIYGGEAVFYAENNFNNHAFFGNRVNNVIISGINLNGNGKNQTSVVDGLLFYSSNNITIQNSTLTNCKHRAISFEQTTTESNNIIISGNYMDSLAHGIELKGCDNISISNNTIKNWNVLEDEALELTAIRINRSSNITINNNELHDSNGEIVAITSYFGNGALDNVLIDNNNFYGTRNGISMPIINSRISNNNFIGGDAFWRSGMELYGYNNTINDNYISNGSIVLKSLIVSGDTLLAYNDSIINNIITNTDTSTIYIQIHTAITIGASGDSLLSEDIYIINNTINMTSDTVNNFAVQLGSYFGGSNILKNIYFEDNTVNNSKGDNSISKCIYIATSEGSNDIFINNNNLNYSQTGIEVRNGSIFNRIYTKNNSFKGVNYSVVNYGEGDIID